MKIRKVLNEDRKRVVGLLTEAFDANRSVNNLVIQDKRRIRRIRWLMEYAIEECLEFGKIMISSDGNACAMVLFRDLKRFTLASLWRDLKLVLRVTGIRKAIKVSRKERLIRTAHAVVLGDRLPYYLWFIGVDTTLQGKGLGSELLGMLLADAQACGRVLLLETSTVANIGFYKRAGLQAYQQLDVGYPLYFFKQA